MIRDIEGVSTPPYIGGALGGTVGSDFPPNLPLRGVGGRIEGTVGGSLKARVIFSCHRKRGYA